MANTITKTKLANTLPKLGIELRAGQLTGRGKHWRFPLPNRAELARVAAALPGLEVEVMECFGGSIYVTSKV